MKFAVLGLVMLASGWGRGREAAERENLRAVGDESAAKVKSAVMTVSEADVAADDGLGARGGAEISEGAPGNGDWRVACELKTGAELIFDRGSVRELGSLTLVRWAAPGDPRVSEPVYTALVSCGQKTIEATWPGRRSGTRAGTCGRRLVEAVCEAVARPRRAVSRK